MLAGSIIISGELPRVYIYCNKQQHTVCNVNLGLLNIDFRRKKPRDGIACSFAAVYI